MSRKNPKEVLTQAQLEEILNNMTDIEDETDEILESDSDLDEQQIEENHDDTCSEQDMSDEEEVFYENVEDTFIGKDKTSKLYNTSFVTSKTKQQIIMRVPPGLKGTARQIKTEIDAFFTIIYTDMVDEILIFTNLYINEHRDKTQYLRDRDCRNVDRSELLVFFGLLYLIGIKHGNHTNVMELWEKDGTGIDIVRAVMSYKRFLFIARSLRFDDKHTRSDRCKIDKLSAIRSFFDRFIKNCQNSYNLSEYTTIDEMLHPFRGRCSWIQYIPNKPAKYGIKMYALCDAQTFYTANLEIYCGKQSSGPYDVSNSAFDVVKRLIESVEMTGRNITTDNFYTSIPLARYLLQKKVTLLGTLKKNKREIPQEFLPHKSRAVQSSIFGFQKDYMITSYVPRKSKSVILLSSMHNESTVDMDAKKPQLILDYNKTKGGVDTVDKLCSSYSVSRITKRWPCVIFYNLMNIGGINAFVLHSAANSGKSLKRRHFLKNLAMNLMKEHLHTRSQIETLPRDITEFLSRMFPKQPVPHQEDENPAKRGRCCNCYSEKIKSYTSMKCTQCSAFTCKRHSKSNIVCINCNDQIN